MPHAKKPVLPVRFDPQTMAEQRRELIGNIPVKTMNRLKNTVISMEPTVAVNLRFSRGLYGFPSLTGYIRHTLSTRCERCLEELKISLNQPLEVLLKPKTESISENSDKYEFYEYDGQYLELVNLIEDELLLALPLVPKHKDISLCNQDMIAWLALNEVPTENSGNPFAILKR